MSGSDEPILDPYNDDDHWDYCMVNEESLPIDTVILLGIMISGLTMISMILLAFWS